MIQMAKEFVQNDRLIALIAAGLGTILFAIIAFGHLDDATRGQLTTVAYTLLGFAPVAFGRSILDHGAPEPIHDRPTAPLPSEIDTENPDE